MPASDAPRFFDVRSLDSERGVAEILAVLAAEDVAAVRGLVTPAETRTGLSRLREAFRPEADTREDLKSRVRAPAEVPNYQRLMLGELGTGERNRTFFMRVFNNPAWRPDLYGMRSVFARLARARNRLQGAPEDFCVERPEGATYTLSRIHQFPAGGGFLGEHADSVAARVPLDAGLARTGPEPVYVQLLLVMSRPGEDFEQGGGYYVRGDRRIFYERYTEPGDVLLYNGRTRHGVGAVDPHRPVDLTSPAGRYSALVTLYRVRATA